MRKPRYRILALDLDGTLLNSQKQLSARNREALEMAAAAGVEIVPTTGRFFGGMPEVVRQLPFLRYAITINGARVARLRDDQTLYRCEIPNDCAVQVMRYLDTLPVIYDCFMDNWGWMSLHLQEKASEFAPDAHVLKMLRELRTPVKELKAQVQESGKSVQKIQFFAKTPALRDEFAAGLKASFPALAATSSIVNNLEMNAAGANKGDALRALAAELSVSIEETMAFGDGTNDLSMLIAAGCGIAMANASPLVCQAADRVTADCDHDGVAQALETLLFAD